MIKTLAEALRGGGGTEEPRPSRRASSHPRRRPAAYPRWRKSQRSGLALDRPPQ